MNYKKFIIINEFFINDFKQQFKKPKMTNSTYLLPNNL